VEQQITDTIRHMAKSHVELAKILQEKRDVTVHASNLIYEISDGSVSEYDFGTIIEGAVEVTDSITAYLGSLADLEEAIAENLSCVMKEMAEDSAEE